MIEVKGMLQPSDYVRAQYLHIRPRPILKAIGILILALVLWTAVYSIWTRDFGTLDYLFYLAILFLILNFAVYLPWKTRRIYKQQKSLQRELTFKFDDEGVSASNENAQSLTPWEDYLKWKHNDQLILLYFSDCMYHMVPKRLFADVADFDELRELLPHRIGKSEP
ncbi:MAG: hypothetical protein DRR42_18690 [Gammaproteobacteria bacterium]|nr:MAG: hypothetical protein DRR42_18690 [Gammaproteobacteria bacterium]